MVWNNNKFKPKICPYCKLEFTPNNGNQKYCVYEKCLKENNRFADCHRKYLSNNWERYLAQKISGYNTERKHLQLQDLLNLIESQEYRCALSGVPLTCRLIAKTRVWTNASIDRIDQTRGYELNNIRLVCHIVNIMRNTLSDDQLYKWCELILKERERKL